MSMRIAIVHRYPYESSLGGDGQYIAAIKAYLLERGDDVFEFTTDLLSNRTSPGYRNYYAGWRGHWSVRGGVAIAGHVISFYPKLWWSALRKLLLRNKYRMRNPQDHAPEVKWLHRRLRKVGPDYIIVMFDMILCCVELSEVAPIIAVPGFLKGRESRLIDGCIIPSGDGMALQDQLSRLANAKHVGVNSFDDVAFLQSRGVAGAFYLGFGLDHARFPVAGVRGGSDRTVLFVGAATTSNLESMKWFLAQVWPIVTARVEDAKLRIVGAVADKLQVPSSLQRVDLVGRVDKLQDYYRSASVVAAPLTAGSRGVKIKVAEALAYGCAIVTTSLGIDRGDPTLYREGLRVADLPAEFAEHIIELLTDPESLRVQRQRARAFSEGLFSYEQAFSGIRERISAPGQPWCEVKLA
jgi:glycosyltransferase involved in cell wall biosynthesis